MTPDQFSTDSTAWIDAVMTVLIHIFGKVAIIATAAASGYLWLQQRGLTKRLDEHKGQLAALTQGLIPVEADPAIPPAYPPAGEVGVFTKHGVADTKDSISPAVVIAGKETTNTPVVAVPVAAKIVSIILLVLMFHGCAQPVAATVWDADGRGSRATGLDVKP